MTTERTLHKNLHSLLHVNLQIFYTISVHLSNKEAAKLLNIH